MKLIRLTQGKFAIVDAEDYDFLMQWKWQAHKGQNLNKYYAQRAIKFTKHGKTKQIIIPMANAILNNINTKLLVDHKDGNGLNNQKNNLRICNFSQNQGNRNRSKTKAPHLKYKGVFKNGKNYIAKIQVNKKRINCGTFESQEGAAIAYNKVALEQFGEFAKINVIQEVERCA